MASDNEDNVAHPEITTRLEDKTVEEERDRRVAELMGDDDLRDLLIQRLQDGGHVAKKTTNEAPTWPQFNGQVPFFPFPAPFWGTAPKDAVTNTTPQPVGSTSVSGRPGSSSAQGQETEEGENSEGEDEDTLYLLDEGEALELMEYDPTVVSGDSWEAGEVIDTFLTKYFSKALEDDEIDKIMEDFPKPNCAALQTPKLDEEVKRLIQQAGKDPHYGTEKALYRVQDQILKLAGPLTCLWSDLLNQRTKVSAGQVTLLIQRVLILLGSASHSITQERQRVAWARVNPSSTPPVDEKEEKKAKGTTLFHGGFLEKATKRMEQEKALAKVAGERSKQPANKRRRVDRDPNDLRRFLERGAPAQYGGRNQSRPKPYQQKPYQHQKPRKPYPGKKGKNRNQQ